MSLTCENTHFLLTARRKKTKEKNAKYNRRVVKVRYLKQVIHRWEPQTLLFYQVMNSLKVSCHMSDAAIQFLTWFWTKYVLHANRMCPLVCLWELSYILRDLRYHRRKNERFHSNWDSVKIMRAIPVKEYIFLKLN